MFVIEYKNPQKKLIDLHKNVQEPSIVVICIIIWTFAVTHTCKWYKFIYSYFLYVFNFSSSLGIMIKTNLFIL